MADDPISQDAQDTRPLGRESTVSEVQLQIPFPETFVYSNVSAYSTSMMDVHVSFGEALPDKTVIAKVGIAMTVEHAAHVALSLIQQVIFFEERFGMVRNPAWHAFRPVLAYLSAPAGPQNPPAEPAAE